MEEGILFNREKVIKNKWGKPHLKGYPKLYFNISHCEGAVALGISNIAPVGIDIEKIVKFRPYALNRCFSDFEKKLVLDSSYPEKEFFKLWTLKESYIKALGMGMSYPMKNITFNIEDNVIKSNRSKCRFILLEDSKNYLTSCCYGVGKAISHGTVY
ncbi:4'-phosphopantetheinyl transferase family protein [Clostridium polynesiense]|uniref:4'-phosphopantetheinyl transferase family protein n=1 Tax=Clostridium polynesiense TaxID=1325933 RepID=UPI0006949BE3|nr:4'-phosphopantetheinyl transferase superfamily protein [Clostridium polynesiense]